MVLSGCMCVCMPFTASICIGKKRGRAHGKKRAACCVFCRCLPLLAGCPQLRTWTFLSAREGCCAPWLLVLCRKSVTFEEKREEKRRKQTAVIDKELDEDISQLCFNPAPCACVGSKPRCFRLISARLTSLPCPSLLQPPSTSGVARSITAD